MLTLQTIPEVLTKYGIAAGQKIDPLVVLAEGLQTVNQEKVGRLTEILSYSDEFGRLVSDKLNEPAIKEGYVDQVKDLAEALKDAKEFYEVRHAEGFGAWIQRLKLSLSSFSEGTLQQRFQKSWDGLEKVLGGTVEDVKAQKEVQEAFTQYLVLKKEAEIIANELHKSYGENQYQTAKAVMEKTVSDYVEKAKTVDPADIELMKLQVTRDETIASFRKVDETYNLLDKVRSSIGNSYVLGVGLNKNLEQNIAAEVMVKDKTALLLSTNEDVFNMLKVSATAQESLRRATDATEAMEDAINASIDMIAEQGAEIKRKAVQVAERSTIKPDKIAKLYASLVEHEQFLAKELPKLREQRRREYEANIVTMDNASRDIAAAVASYDPDAGKQLEAAAPAVAQLSAATPK